MSEFDEVQKLIRLKRYERPPQGYVDNFLVEFHCRQRAELLNRSARSLFFERLATYASGFGRQKWILGAGAAYAAFMVAYFAWPGSSADQGNASASVANQSAAASQNVLWGRDSGDFDIEVELHPVEYLHPVLNGSNVRFDPVVPVSFELAPVPVR